MVQLLKLFCSMLNNNGKSGFVTIVLILSSQLSLASDTRFFTRTHQGNAFGIARSPLPQNFSRMHPTDIATVEQLKKEAAGPWKFDLRSLDASRVPMGKMLSLLLDASFDSQTKWPNPLPAGFSPESIMDLGASSGLGIRELHRKGMVGKGVGIAIIDTPILVDHSDYKKNLVSYEEIHLEDDGNNGATMHGCTLASLAVGQRCGVAPGASLYYIATTEGDIVGDEFKINLVYIAQSIDRIVEINQLLAPDKKIRAIVIARGWSKSDQGYESLSHSIEKAKVENIFVVSPNIEETYGISVKFSGLGRDPLLDPDDVKSYGAGDFWKERFRTDSDYQKLAAQRLLFPMDSRTAASPTGREEYAFYRYGGWSWVVPYIAGIYAMACQAYPRLDPKTFWAISLHTGIVLAGETVAGPGQCGILVNPKGIFKNLSERNDNREVRGAAMHK